MEKPDKYMIHIHTQEGFIELFHQLCQEYSSQEQAYEAAERVHRNYWGENRYENFESFKSLKNRKARKVKGGKK